MSEDTALRTEKLHSYHVGHSPQMGVSLPGFGPVRVEKTQAELLQVLADLRLQHSKRIENLLTPNK
jgi:GTP-binding protein EngB required for normal cell division